MAFIFLARGLFVLSVLPPLEGWDEYQHVAYIEFLRQNDRPPVLGQDFVPPSLHDDIVRLPHGDLALNQLRKLGALSHEEFWNQPTPRSARADAGRLRLYQAQHASLYYRLVAPLYALVRDRAGFVPAITTLRVLNILFGALALYVALWSIGRIVRAAPWNYLIALLIAAHPLYLLNCARVANDALALLLGTAAVAWLLILDNRRLYISSALIGLLLGLAILGKTINLSLLPLVAFVFIHLAWRKTIRPRQAALALALLLGVTATVTYDYFAFNLRQFGLLTPMQEAVKNHEQGRTASDYLAAAKQLDWYRELSRRALRHSLWTGGWSYLSPDWSAADRAGWPILSDHWPVRLHQWLICIAAIAGLLLISRRWRASHWILDRPGAGWRTTAMAAGLAAGLCYHMLQTQLALGSVATNVWYACIAFPWLLMLFVQGLRALPGRSTAIALALLMLSIFVIQEIYGTAVQMAQHYYGAGLWTAQARDRAESLSGLPMEFGIPAALAALLLLALATRAALNPPPRPPSPSAP